MRKPVPEFDPKTPVQKVVRKHIGWQLRCDRCDKPFLFHRDKRMNHQLRTGWKTLMFCSRECKNASRT